MRKLLFLLLPIVVGCSTVEHNPIDYTSTLEQRPLLDVEIRPLPTSPYMRKVVVDGDSYGALSLEDIDKLIELREQARLNTELAVELVGLSDALIAERNSLVELSVELERLVNSLLEHDARETSKQNRMVIIHNIERIINQIALIGISLR